jgi:DNA-binding XRE family transcriptional regulator
LAQVLAYTQRKIRVKLNLSNEKFSPRKLFPVSPKTLGDYLMVKRYEADLNQAEVAAKLKVAEITLRAWEYDRKAPNDIQLLALKELLSLNTDVLQPQPYTTS